MDMMVKSQAIYVLEQLLDMHEEAENYLKDENPEVKDYADAGAMATGRCRALATHIKKEKLIEKLKLETEEI